MKREVQETTENETLRGDEAAVSQLLAGLEHIEAPANFKRRVMAKIADGQQPSRRVFGLPLAVAYSLPLLLALVVAAGYVINFRRPSQTPAAPEVTAGLDQKNDTGSQPAPVNENTNRSSDEYVAAQGPGSHRLKTISSERGVTNTLQRKRDANDDSGSFEIGLGNRSDVRPSGTSGANRFDANRNDVMGVDTHPVSAVLSQLGISSDYKGGWVVRSVAPYSLAGRSGVKIGDVIISLDHTVLSGDTVFKGGGGASSIRVRRNGQELELPLR